MASAHPMRRNMVKSSPADHDEPVMKQAAMPGRRAGGGGAVVGVAKIEVKRILRQMPAKCERGMACAAISIIILHQPMASQHNIEIVKYIKTVGRLARCAR